MLIIVPGQEALKGYIFDYIKVCCLFSLESPHLGQSNEYTKYTIFNIKKTPSPKLS